MRQKRIKACADRTTCKQHVIHQHHVPSFHREAHVVFVGREGLGMRPDVVAEERDIHLATAHLLSLKQRLQALLEPFSQTHPSGLQPHQIRF